MSLNFTNMQKQKYMKIANKLTPSEIHDFHKMFIDKEIPGRKTPLIGIYHKDMENILEFAEAIGAKFEMTRQEVAKLNKELDEPITIVWEGYYEDTKENKACLLNKTVEEIQNYINKLIYSYDGANRYATTIAFIYKYLVDNGLEDRVVDISDIKSKIMNKRKITDKNKDIKQPIEKRNYYDQEVPF